MNKAKSAKAFGFDQPRRPMSTTVNTIDVVIIVVVTASPYAAARADEDRNVKTSTMQTAANAMLTSGM